MFFTLGRQSSKADLGRFPPCQIGTDVAAHAHCTWIRIRRDGKDRPDPTDSSVGRDVCGSRWRMSSHAEQSTPVHAARRLAAARTKRFRPSAGFSERLNGARRLSGPRRDSQRIANIRGDRRRPHSTGQPGSENAADELGGSSRARSLPPSSRRPVVRLGRRYHRIQCTTSLGTRWGISSIEG